MLVNTEAPAVPAEVPRPRTAATRGTCGVCKGVWVYRDVEAPLKVLFYGFRWWYF